MQGEKPTVSQPTARSRLQGEPARTPGHSAGCTERALRSSWNRFGGEVREGGAPQLGHARAGVGAHSLSGPPGQGVGRAVHVRACAAAPAARAPWRPRNPGRRARLTRGAGPARGFNPEAPPLGRTKPEPRAGPREGGG